MGEMEALVAIDASADIADAVFFPDDRNLAHIAKMLPPDAMTLWCEAANAAHEMGGSHNDAVKVAWDTLAQAGWNRPRVGKKWIRKDNPTPGADVHTDVPLGSETPPHAAVPPKKKRKPIHAINEYEGGDDEEDMGDQIKAPTYKAGARHNRGDVGKIQEIHDHACSLGAKCDDPDVSKDAEINAEINAIGEPFELTAAISKVDDSLGIVFGWAIVCSKNDEPYYDLQGDHIPEDSMLKAAADFMQSSRVCGDMHMRDENGNAVQDGSTVFMWPVTKDINDAMGSSSQTTGLMIGVKPSSEVLGKFKSGEYTGFSIGGYRLEDEIVNEDGVAIKMWSDAAREAALDARRKNSSKYFATARDRSGPIAQHGPFDTREDAVRHAFAQHPNARSVTSELGHGMHIESHSR